jgi:hypothetical protein
MSQFSTYLEIVQEEKYDFLFNESDDNRKLLEDLDDKIANAIGISVFATNILLSILLYHGTKHGLIEPNRIKVRDAIVSFFKDKTNEQKNNIKNTLKNKIVNFFKDKTNIEKIEIERELKTIENKEQIENFIKKYPEFELTSRDRN